jgi:hypothetical protein
VGNLWFLDADFTKKEGFLIKIRKMREKWKISEKNRYLLAV